MPPAETEAPSIVIVGGGPAGLMAAEAARANGADVDIYDAMPSPGRKFLLAGKGGLNLTHAEPLDRFLTRYGEARPSVEPWLNAFTPDALRAWAQALGVETFVGSSGRVFPREMKAAPLLRAWLHRLRSSGVRLHARHRWLGWNSDGTLVFSSPQGAISVRADAVILAMGGGSRAALGSDGAGLELLKKRGVSITALRPTNCGFDASWSAPFQARFAGKPVKPVAIAYRGVDGREFRRQGEFVITDTGVEGSLIYALSATLRDDIAANGSTVVRLDLAPDRDLPRLTNALSRPHGKLSLSNRLRRMHIGDVKLGLLRELASAQDFNDTTRLAQLIKALPLTLTATRPMDEAISTAGGVALDALDERLMLKNLPGVFCAGEMLDWEAPTGGYLLTACLAGGKVAGNGACAWWSSMKTNPCR